MTADTEEERFTSRRSRAEEPGVVVVFAVDRALCMPFPLDGRPLVLGRDCPEGASIDDARISRRHVEISRTGKGWQVRDLGSRNGTRVDGGAVTGTVVREQPPVVGFGRAIALAVPDVLLFLGASPMRAGELVQGPAWRAALAEVAALAGSGADILISGESGSGKERAAAHFHATGPRARGPFIPVNCAAIPHGIAERLLFGTVKGAYSGASAEAHGYVRAAHGGVLFLDEFGELELEVQAKLLRVIETKEAIAVGASRRQIVDVAFCLATNRDLRAAVAAGTFRSDLYYRVSQWQVALPPLRARREEIPWIAELAVKRTASELGLSPELVEACMLRPWPGNVRELLGEIQQAARAAKSQSRRTVRADLLSPHAGQPAQGAPLADASAAAAAAASATGDRPAATADRVTRALQEAGSVSGAARMLGIHRSHLYRLIHQFGIDVRTLPRP
jgi:transcriptional regulator with GAF, ATPase, and Fis domain